VFPGAYRSVRRFYGATGPVGRLTSAGAPPVPVPDRRREHRTRPFTTFIPTAFADTAL